MFPPDINPTESVTKNMSLKPGEIANVSFSSNEITPYETSLLPASDSPYTNSSVCWKDGRGV